jgi:integrase
MPRERFTKANVDRWIREGATDAGGVMYFDTNKRGLGLRVRPTGKAVFFAQYVKDGRRRRIVLGEYGAWTVDTVAEEYDRIAGEVANKVDPLDKKKTEKEQRDARRRAPAQRTVADEVRDYMAAEGAGKASARDITRYLNRLVAAYGSKPLAELTKADVKAVYDAIRAEGHRVGANRWLATVKACLQLACEADRLTSNPAALVKLDSKVEKAGVRKRTLTDAELSRLLGAIADISSPHVKIAFVLLTSTGARLSEVLNCQWSNLDLDGARWHLPHTKGGHPQSIPLAAPVVEALRAVPHAGPYVAAGASFDKPRADLKKPWAALRVAADLPDDVRIHDLRRTHGLAIARIAGLHVASKALRHSSVTVTAKHYLGDLDDDVRAALDKRAEVVDVIKLEAERKARRRGA